MLLVQLHFQQKLGLLPRLGPLPVPVSWWVHSLSLCFCIIITSKRSTSQRTSCYFWWSLCQLFLFHRASCIKLYSWKKSFHMWFLGVLAMGCHIDGITVNTAPRIYPDEVWRRVSKRRKKGGRRKKERKKKETSFKAAASWFWTHQARAVLGNLMWEEKRFPLW